MKAEASKFLDVIDQTGFTDEACQIIYQHLSKIFVVILHTHTHKEVKANTVNQNCLNPDLELTLTLKYRYTTDFMVICSKSSLRRGEARDENLYTKQIWAELVWSHLTLQQHVDKHTGLHCWKQEK